MKIAIAGGGTGGHISPAIAVAEAIQLSYPEATIDFIRTPRPVDRRMYEKFGTSVHELDPPRIDRGFADTVLLPLRALRVFFRARRLLRELDASVLFATGGYPSFFPVVAARSLRIPAVIHESNSIPGKANRIASRFANLILTGFELSQDGFAGKTVYSGNPVRPSMHMYEKDDARRRLNIPDDALVVLFLGGSQGAKALNDYALKVPDGVHLLLQCGERDFNRVREAKPDRDSLRVFDFTDDPALLYCAADIAVARSGAMTVAELTWFRLPAVYVPYPYAADDHQRWNASEICRKGGALMIEQQRIAGEDLWGTIIALLENSSELRKMRDCLESIMPENPAGQIAGILMDIARRDSVDGS